MPAGANAYRQADFGSKQPHAGSHSLLELGLAELGISNWKLASPTPVASYAVIRHNLKRRPAVAPECTLPSLVTAQVLLG